MIKTLFEKIQFYKKFATKQNPKKYEIKNWEYQKYIFNAKFSSSKRKLNIILLWQTQKNARKKKNKHDKRKKMSN